MKPMEIEKQSFAIIEKELTTQIPPQYKPCQKSDSYNCGFFV